MEEKYGKDVRVIDSYFPCRGGNALAGLSEDIRLLSCADAAVFTKGWEDARGCRIEHSCCVEYGTEIIQV